MTSSIEQGEFDEGGLSRAFSRAKPQRLMECQSNCSTVMVGHFDYMRLFPTVFVCRPD